MKFEKEQLLKLYTNLVRARAWDQMCMSLLGQGKLLAFYHAAYGGEAPGVGSCSTLRKDDILWPHHRGHGIPHMIAKGIDPKTYLAEHCGKTTGCCGGMSSFHQAYPEEGLYGSSGTIGSCFPLSLGWGMAAQRNPGDQIVMCCFGDGAFSRGTFHESMLMAVNMKLPIVWLCENNGVQEMTALKEVVSLDHLSDQAAGYGIPTAVVDGQDVIAVAEAVAEPIKRAREGKGPSFVECITHRYTPHALGIQDFWGDRLRTDEEIKDLIQETDPVVICRNQLLEQGILTTTLVEQTDQAVALEIQEAEKFVDESENADASCLGPEAVYAD